MAKFLMLARRSPFASDISPEEMQRIIARYRAWTERIQNSGKLAGAAGLRQHEGRVLREGSGGKPAVTDGPYAEAKEVVGGYWVIEAASYDEVIALTHDHPGLQAGTLEIRQLM
jgi:hypothetical protein